MVVKKTRPLPEQKVINEKIQKAAKDLLEKVLLGTKVYYLDECMFTTRTYYNKDYAAKYRNITLP